MVCTRIKNCLSVLVLLKKNKHKTPNTVGASTYSNNFPGVTTFTGPYFTVNDWVPPPMPMLFEAPRGWDGTQHAAL